MSHTIHLANNSNQDIQCIVMPNKDWIIADVFGSAAMMIFSGVKAVKTTSDLIRIYKTLSMGSWSIDFAQGIAKFFEEYAKNVAKGDCVAVYSTSMANPLSYFNPSKVASLFRGVSNMSILLRTTDGKYTCSFNTNDDLSWIVKNEGSKYICVRAKYGKLWVPEPSKGTYSFNEVKISSQVM